MLDIERKDIMFTAEEYRTAAKVLAEEPDPAEGGLITVQYLNRQAERTELREKKLRELGMQLIQINQANDVLYNGSKLAVYLIASGWTEPEGLF